MRENSGAALALVLLFKSLKIVCMKFSAKTKRDARLRQWSNCASCGTNLDNLYEVAHHVQPDALGGEDAAENCVILCEDCHEHIHNAGNFRSLVVAPRDFFVHFNG
jgi:5-methylcytosine-specific restriction endonuclease McrA